MVNRPCNWKCTGYGSKEPGMILKCTWFNKMMENNGSETVLVQENLFMLLYPRSTGGGVYCFTSVRPSVQDIFHHIFLSNY